MASHEPDPKNATRRPAGGGAGFCSPDCVAGFRQFNSRFISSGPPALQSQLSELHSSVRRGCAVIVVVLIERIQLLEHLVVIIQRLQIAYRG